MNIEIPVVWVQCVLAFFSGFCCREIGDVTVPPEEKVVIAIMSLMLAVAAYTFPALVAAWP